MRQVIFYFTCVHFTNFLNIVAYLFPGQLPSPSSVHVVSPCRNQCQCRYRICALIKVPNAMETQETVIPKGPPSINIKWWLWWQTHFNPTCSTSKAWLEVSWSQYTQGRNIPCSMCYTMWIDWKGTPNVKYAWLSYKHLGQGTLRGDSQDQQHRPRALAACWLLLCSLLQHKLI